MSNTATYSGDINAFWGLLLSFTIAAILTFVESLNAKAFLQATLPSRPNDEMKDASTFESERTGLLMPLRLTRMRTNVNLNGRV
jgi:hypothetical protein